MTTYYVDYANGADVTSAGTTANPWKTVKYACTRIAAGDTLKLRGSDVETEVFWELGARINPPDNVTIEADAGHTPVLATGSYIAAADFSKTSGRTNVYEAALGGTLYVDNPIWHDYDNPSLLTKVADVATCDTTPNSFYYDGSATLYVNAGGTPPASVIAQVSVNSFFQFTTDGLTLNNLLFKFCCRAIEQNNAYPYPDGATLSNCTFRYQSRRATDGSVVVERGTMTISNVAGYDSYVSDLIRVEDVGNVVASDIISEDGGKLTAAGGSLTLTGYAGNGQIFCGDGTAWAIANVVVHDVPNNQVELRGSGTLQRFVLYLSAGNFEDTVQIKGLVLHGAGEKKAYHGVIYNLALSSLATPEAYYIGSDDAITIHNCAAVNCDTAFFVAATNTPTLTLDYNGIYNCGLAFSNIAAGDQGTYNVTEDPLFAGPGGLDFTLQPGSPYVDAGIAVLGINDDYNGSAPDIGRYEADSPTAGRSTVAVSVAVHL